MTLAPSETICPVPDVRSAALMIEHYGSEHELTPSELLDAFHEGLAAFARDKRTTELGQKLLATGRRSGDQENLAI